MAAQEIQMDLLDALRADANGELARRLLGQLRDIEQRLQRGLRQLNDRDTYLQLNAAKQAVSAAIAVLSSLEGGRGRIGSGAST